MRLEERLGQIIPVSEEAMEQARMRWSHVAKPLGSLGVLEEDVQKLAAISGTENLHR